MEEQTIVRQNLMDDPDYTPYCGNNIARQAPGGCNNPRTQWTGQQFRCPTCGLVSMFPEDFIERYKEKHNK